MQIGLILQFGIQVTVCVPVFLAAVVADFLVVCLKNASLGRYLLLFVITVFISTDANTDLLPSLALFGMNANSVTVQSKRISSG